MAAPTIDWYRTPIDKETLRQLTQRSDLRGWIQSGSFLLIYAALTTLTVYTFSMRWWVLMVIACYAHALFLNMMSMAAAVHELSHGTPFRTKPVNEFFLYLFCFLTWNNPVHFRASHILNHHPYTVHRGLDKEVIQAPVKEKLNWVNILSWSTFDWSWFAVFIRVNVLHALGKGDADFFNWDPLFSKDDPRRRSMCTWARIMVVGYLVILAAAIVFHLWVVIFLVFSYFFARILANLTGAIQHTGLGSDIPDWRCVCHTVKVNPVIRYLYWNMNYHTEHHMYAAVPFFNLAKLRKAIEKDAPAAHPSLAACLAKLYEIKAVQKKDPSFIYSHTFPSSATPPRLSAR
jgi:fatty acid desaturase